MKTVISSFSKIKCLTKKGGIEIRTVLLILLAITLLTFLAVYIINKISSDQKMEEGKMTQSRKVESTSETINEQAINDIEKTTEIMGIVSGIQVPKDGNVIFLIIETSIIDKSKLGETDFSQGTVDIKMEKKIFNVAVDENTNLNVTDKSKINLGDFVMVKSPISIYETEKFTALQVEVQTKTQQ